MCTNLAKLVVPTAFMLAGVMQVKNIDKENTEVVLRTDGSGQGMEGDEGMDVLPPLAPGQKPRAQGTDQS